VSDVNPLERILAAGAEAQLRMQAELGLARLELYLHKVAEFEAWCRTRCRPPELGNKDSL
jgi:hypothetical protein